MSNSYTYSESSTFTITHAKRLASKVATDLKRIQRFYGYPSDDSIAIFEQELIVLIKGGFIESVTYGFKRNEGWIEPTLRYSAKDLGADASTDDDPGKVRPGANVSGASFSSYLSRNSRWFELSEAEREEINNEIALKRSFWAEPAFNGVLTTDLNYSAGGRALSRSSLRSY